MCFLILISKHPVLFSLLQEKPEFYNQRSKITVIIIRYSLDVFRLQSQQIFCF